jgi:hypothetical protein
MACEPAAPTYRQLGFTDLDRKCPKLLAVKYPDAYAHVDPEFQSFTYGHMKRVGDDILWELRQGDILFFYSTLDLLPDRKRWSVYIIGYFEVDEKEDTRGKTQGEIRSLPGFQSNAHLRHVNVGADLDLLVRGSTASRLYEHAIPLSEVGDPTRVHSSFVRGLSTVTGRAIEGGRTWHRWILCGEDELFAAMLRSHDA